MRKSRDANRKPRADALRNRERLIETAKAGFTEMGADVSLEEIARRAEVGIGTLYRHFPTRAALVETVYRREIEHLAAAVEPLLAEHAPAEALRRWMRLFVDYLRTKRLILPALKAAGSDPAAVYATSGGLMPEAVTKLLERAIGAGQVRPDVTTGDIMQAMIGIAHNMDAPGWRESALRLVDILTAGLRPPSD